MPHRIWKCDYCTDTNELLNDIMIHESQCCFNPLLKNCYSCINHTNVEDDAFGELYVCDKGLDADLFEDEGNCKYWESE